MELLSGTKRMKKGMELEARNARLVGGAVGDPMKPLIAEDLACDCGLNFYLLCGAPCFMKQFPDSVEPVLTIFVELCPKYTTLAKVIELSM